MTDSLRLNNLAQAESQSASSRPGKRPTIGLLTYWIGISHVDALWAGVDDVAREHDANLICLPGRALNSPLGFAAQGNVLYDLVSLRHLDGLVICTGSLGSFVSHEEVQAFCERYRPLPMVSNALPLDGIPSLVMDNYQGMAQAVKHLVDEHGCLRIVFIRGPEGHHEAEERYRAYQDVLAEHGIAFDPALVTPGNFIRTSGQEAIRLLLDERKVEFEAVVSAADEMAIGAIEAMQARGIHVPSDVAVISFDDNEESQYVTPPLTTVRQSTYEQGRRTAQMLFAQMAGEKVPEQVMLPAELIVRRSCGCLDPEVVQVAIDPACAGKESLEQAVSNRRQEILRDMAQATRTPRDGPIPSWSEQVLDAFSAEVRGETSGDFLRVMDEALTKVLESGSNAALWQGVVSTLRRHTLPYIRDRAALARAENLCNQARVMIGGAIQLSQAQYRLRKARQEKVLREIGDALITAYDTDTMAALLAEDLPNLGVKRAYLSLYERPEAPAEWARLILVYDETEKVLVEAEGRRFPSTELVPADLLPSGRRYSLVVEPLYFRREQLGFVVFEKGPEDGLVYETLREQLSGALKGALLLQARTQAERETKRRAAQAMLIHEVAQRVSGKLELKALFLEIVAAVQEAFDYHGVGVLLLDEESDRLIMQAVTGAYAHLVPPGLWLTVREGMTGRAAATGETQLSKDVSQNPFYVSKVQQGTKSELVVPIQSGQKVIGVLDLQSDELDAFDESDAMVMETLADQLAVAIENARLYEAIEQELNERRRAEAALRQSNLELQARNEELNAFAYTVAHDIQNSVTFITGMAEVLAEECGDMSAETMRRHLRSVLRSGRQIGTISQELLLLARVRKADVEAVSLDMASIVKRAQQRLEPLALEHQAQVVEPTAWPTALGYGPWIEEVWVNYLSNAFKYGGEPPQVELGATVQPGGTVRFWVRDNGRGLSTEDQKRLFTPFTRLDPVRSSGHGLGLSIVRRIVERLGGQVKVESEGIPGRGCVFSFTLPATGGAIFRSPESEQV